MKNTGYHDDTTPSNQADKISQDMKDSAELSGQQPHELRKSTMQDLRQMQQIASIVATTVLVQLTVSVITRPGQYGWDDDNAITTMARNAAFSVYLVAETITFFDCMLAVIFLCWSIVAYDADRSMMLVLRSKLLLMVALLGILVIYTTRVIVISPAFSWDNIWVTTIFSLYGIWALFFKVLSN